VFVFWSKIASPKIVFWKAHFYDAQSTCSAEDFMFFADFDAVNIPKFEDIVLG
jgi:hypothetical protein